MEEKGNLTVVVVDDDPAIRRLIRLYLNRHGYAMIEAATGGDASAVMQSADWHVAILDRRLPDMDGVEVCRHIKSDPLLRNRYVIMLTGEDEQQDKIEGLDLGADDYVTKPFQPLELLARIRAGKRIVDLQQDLVEKNRRLELLSVTDGLTGLHNHRYFQDELLRAFDESARYQRPLSLALIDIDFFKKVNDTYGHASGDEVLKAVSQVFENSIRATDLVARYGGEEFAIMMPETDREDAATVAEKIRRLIEEMETPTDEGELRVTVSIGVCTVPRHPASSARELIEAADKALYRAKRGGRNQVQFERRTRSRESSSAVAAR